MKKYNVLGTIKNRKKWKTEWTPKKNKASAGQKEVWKSTWFVMNTSIAAFPLGKALKNIEIVNDENYRKVCTAFLLGVVDAYGQILNLREEEIVELVKLYLSKRYPEKEFGKQEANMLFKWLLKNYMQKKILDIKQKGGDLAFLYYNTKQPKPLQLFNCVYDNQGAFVKKAKKKKKKLFGIF
jgi:hypothetical protein